MGFLSRLLGGGSRLDDEPYADQEEHFYSNPVMRQHGLPPVDMLEGGEGAFGSITNPIPVNGAQGEIIYLNRLRTLAGRPFVYHRTGTVDSPLIPHPIDRYEMVAVDGSEWRVLYFSLYHPRRTQMVPPSFQRSAWPKEAVEQIFVRTPVGVADWVDDFPHGLPDAFERWAPGKMPDQMIGMVRRTIERLLENMPLDAQRPPELEAELESIHGYELVEADDGEAFDDEPFESQRAESIELHAEDNGVKLLADVDELPGAEGPFGSRGNPIAVNGFGGMYTYLNRLRTEEGDVFVYQMTDRVSSSLAPGGLVRLELVSRHGDEWRVLYFSLNHPRRSQLVPPGLRRSPWPRDERRQEMLTFSLGAFEYYASFPQRLPEVFAQQAKEVLDDDIADLIVEVLKLMVSEMPPNVTRPRELDNQ